MPLYSQILSNDCILNMINPSYKRILLLGCGGCMNESLAFLHSCPIVIHNETDTFPAIETECNRLIELLHCHGFSAKKIIIPPGSNIKCIRNICEKKLSFPEKNSIDVILVLSCYAGYWGFSKVFENVPMFNITKTTGALYYKYFDNEKERIIIDGKIWPLSAEKYGRKE